MRSPGNHLKFFAVNSALLLGTLLLLALIFECLVFRFILPAADLPQLFWENSIIKYQSGDTGIFRVRDEIAARFRINAQGWNSGHAAYAHARRPGTTRIAVIGDSYVEALQVNYDKSFAELLAQRFTAPQHKVEIYRFGIGGAPFSQYLHMLRSEVLSYSPNLVVLNLVHNDFTESFRFKPGVYTSSFSKLDVQGGIVHGELPPTPWQPAWYEWIRRSATWRFFSVRQGVSFAPLRDLLLGKTTEPVPLQANIDLRDVQSTPRRTSSEAGMALDKDVVAATRYLLTQFHALSKAHHFTPVVMMDGVRTLIESGSPEVLNYGNGALQLNKLVRDLCTELQLPMLDLHPIFTGEYALHHEHFGHAHDAHWNGQAHALVADALADFLTSHNLLP